MKKFFKAALFMATLALGVNVLNAETMDLKDIDTNTLIVGDRVFELNVYPVTLYDAVEATNEYAENHPGEKAHIYIYGENKNGKFLKEVTGPMDKKTLETPTKDVNINSIYPKSKVEVTHLNGVEYTKGARELTQIIKEKETLLVSQAANLKKNAVGFSSVEYANKTMTFTISNLNAGLVESEEAAVKVFKALVSNAKSATYTINGSKKTVQLSNLSDAKIIEYAHELLKDMAGSNSLKLKDVANKSKTIEVLYTKDNAQKSVTYTLKFVYDATSELNKLEVDKSVSLSNELSKIELSGYGISKYSLSNNVLTLTIGNGEANLASLATDEIVNLIKSELANISNVSYTINGTKKSIDVANLSKADIVAKAHTVLSELVGSKSLTLANVKGKTITFDVTLELYGQSRVVTYTLKFV